jgi:drug/metabolite transporter (DMT)-like permease
VIPAILPPAHGRWDGRDRMTVFALVLVLAAATFHATWNLLAKRVGDGGAVFVWLFGALSMLVYAPLAVVVVLLEGPHFGSEALVFMFGSGVLHLGYFVLLQRGYAVGDLSLVYPLARGTGPCSRPPPPSSSSASGPGSSPCSASASSRSASSC